MAEVKHGKKDISGAIGDADNGGKEIATKPESTIAKAAPPVTGPQMDPYSQPEQQVSLPRLKIIQDLSEEHKREENPVPLGSIYNVVTKEDMGKRLQFIAFKHILTRVRFVRGQGLACRSIDMRQAQMMGGKTADLKPTANCGLCVLREWPEQRIAITGERLSDEAMNSGPECSVVDNFLALAVRPGTGTSGENDYEWVIPQFSRASAKAAKDLKSLWLNSEAPLENFVYELRSVLTKDGTNAFYKQEIARVRPSTPEERARVDRLRSLVGGTVVDSVAEEEAGIPRGTARSPQEAEAEATKKGF